MAINRYIHFLKRKIAAAKLSVTFERSATFQLPERIKINGQIRSLYLPNENGVKVAFIDLLLDDCYKYKELDSPEIKTVLDIGANVRLFGVAARNAFPSAQIHAYEPNPFLEKYLEVQAKSANFEYHMEAVGLGNGSVSLDFHTDSVQTRSLTDVSGQIPQTSFRETIARLGGKVDLVKMDCEGAEWDIFQDVNSWQRVRHVTMEYHLWPNHTHDEVLAVIRSLGFRVREHKPTELDFGLLIASRG